MRALTLFTLISLGCAGTPQRSASTPALSGRFALTGGVAQSDCPFEIILGARHLEVDLGKGTALADVVNRTYAAAEERGALVAEGTFPVPYCEGATLHERWTLLRTSDGLTGVLAARWPLVGACDQVCSVLIDVEAVRLPSAEP